MRTLGARLVAAVLILGLLLAPGFGSPDRDSMSPDAAERHVAGEALASSDHGHSHEDDDPVGHPAGHLHGHDPADHSHQFGFVHQAAVEAAPSTDRKWPAQTPSRAEPALPYGIERPPKSVLTT